jgi:hypothetical protein
VSGVFAVEVSLPEREGWVRIALTPGNWLVLFGWARDFNLLTTDDRVLFRGRAPYDEIQYDLDGVSIVFWYCGYALDLKGYPWFKDIFQGMTIYRAIEELSTSKLYEELKKEHHLRWVMEYFRLGPRVQYESGFLCGEGIIMRVSTKKPVLLEFKVLEYDDPKCYFGCHRFYSEDYLWRHTNRLSAMFAAILTMLNPGMLLLYWLAIGVYEQVIQFILLPAPPRRRRFHR